MNITKDIKVPTGHIYIGDGEKGPLEFLCIGDYGKERNIKADFLGLTKQIYGVENGNPMPLTEKCVITISSQYGCSMKCAFCDVPKVGPGINATVNDMLGQVDEAIRNNFDSETVTDRLNIHFARMGEPTWNPAVLEAAIRMKDRYPAIVTHPVVSTMMPWKNKRLRWFIETWMWIKNEVYGGEAGLQISVNTTDAGKRGEQFGGEAMSLWWISDWINDLPVRGRKITLNIALTNDPVDANHLSMMFNPRKFLVKITPMHMTRACESNGMKTEEGYTSYQPYEPVEEALKAAGFDVIVFIPSPEEDESRITCGNAILSRIEDYQG